MEFLECDLFVKYLETTIKDFVATVTMMRGDIHNAFDPTMIEELTDLFVSFSENDEVRIVVLKGSGKSFCAGADLNWMKSLAGATKEENIKDAQKLETLFHSVGNFSKPLITLVNGPAIGGGCGLACCGDIVLATEKALFGLSEVRLGILPAVIAPYVIRRIGFAASSRYMLTGERFGATEAKEIGLVTEVIEESNHLERLEYFVINLLKGGIEAQGATKKLMRDFRFATSTQEVAKLTAEAIAARRVSAEGQEGMKAFFEKRSPNWFVT